MLLSGVVCFVLGFVVPDALISSSLPCLGLVVLYALIWRCLLRWLCNSASSYVALRALLSFVVLHTLI